MCMSGDGKLVLWVHACLPCQLARLYNSGVCVCVCGREVKRDD